MKHLLNKIRKKSPKPSLGIPTDPTHITVGPSGSRAELNIDPKDDKGSRSSGTVFQDKASEDQRPPAPEASAPGAVVGGSDPTKEDAVGTGEGGPSEVSRVSKRNWKKTAIGGAAIALDVASEAGESFGPLKAVLGVISTIYANYKETVAVSGKIQDLCSRIAALEVIFGAPAGDVVEEKRRNGLLLKLEEIEKQLKPLCEKSSLQRFAEHVQDDEEISGFLEDLQEAIGDYQMVQQIAIYEQGCKLIDAAEVSVLNSIRCAHAAEYRHGSRKGCLKGTRRAVLNKIEVWISDYNSPPVHWLNGLAGTGKSTIAQTIAERTFANGQLGASFFCSRDFLDRSDLQFIFPTLAVQLARKYHEIRSILVPLVQSDPELVHESLYNQMEKLIVQPLEKSGISTVIVIDALDECRDDEPASAILSSSSLTGRPERRIREGFRLPLMAKATDIFVLHEVEPSQVDSDIELFFRHRLLETVDPRDGLNDWPTKEQLDLLCERAAGLFVYAVATVKFINQYNNDPKVQLDLILQSPEDSAREGEIELKKNTTLDLLYMSILKEAFGGDSRKDDPKTRSVLGAVTLAANPLSPSTIAKLLGSVSTLEVFRRLSSIQSLLILQDGFDRFDHPVRPFHKSFPDFIVDSDRCMNQRFRVSPPDQHSELLIGCLELMNQRLKKNMCKMPDAVNNSEVYDLRERAEQYINPGLRYACESWHKHFVDAHTAPAHTSKITSVLHRFLEEKFVFWLEVLSVLGSVRDAVDALQVTAKWLGASPTLDLVNDYFRFVTGFFEIISTSAPHIYHSALPQSPRTSIVRRLYERYVHPLMRVVWGVPVSWDPAIAIRKHPNLLLYNPAWSPCSRFIALGWINGTQIQILDGVTLEPLKSFAIPGDPTRLLTFSPEGRLLTWVGDGVAISWDVHTGVAVSKITTDERSARSITYSACGTMFGVLFSGKDDSTAIGTYHVHPSTPTHYHPIKEPVSGTIWTFGECIRFATSGPGSITIWEVGFTSEHPPSKIDSLRAPDNFDPSKYCLFLPTPSRLAFIDENTVSVWDAQRSKLLLSSVDVKNFLGMNFSPDGRFFACRTDESETCLWKESPTGYILHQKLISIPGYYHTQLLSPNGQSIVVTSATALQLWSTAGSPTSPSSVSIQTPKPTGSFILELSPDRSLAAAARSTGNMATVFDLKSGVQRLVVDTGTKVYGLRVAGDTIVIVGEGKIVTWNLPVGDSVVNARANDSDAVRTVMFDYSTLSWLPGEPLASISPDFNYIALTCYTDLHIYDASTGKHLQDARTQSPPGMPWFTPDGHEVWCWDGGWEIVKDSESDVTKLEFLGEPPTRVPSGGLPWQSSHGYQVTDGGWILSPSGKRLFWLQPLWREDEMTTLWSGQFLGLLQFQLPDVVVLESLEEVDSAAARADSD
ncbi:hypothetical protein F5888DRAFT_1908745 [Russula emetica]|nr:hypothetical protein F5888DRAFT_1908745 [Russula emetica]